MNGDHFLVSGIRASQHNISETKSIKPLSTFHFFCSWFPLIAMTSSQPLRRAFLLVLSISCTIPSLLTQTDHHYDQSLATVLKRKWEKKMLTDGLQTKSPKISAWSTSSFRKWTWSDFTVSPLHLLIAQLLKHPSCSPPQISIHPGRYTRNVIYFVSKHQKFHIVCIPPLRM